MDAENAGSNPVTHSNTRDTLMKRFYEIYYRGRIFAGGDYANPKNCLRAFRQSFNEDPTRIERGEIEIPTPFTAELRIGDGDWEAVSI